MSIQLGLRTQKMLTSERQGHLSMMLLRYLYQEKVLPLPAALMLFAVSFQVTCQTKSHLMRYLKIRNRYFQPVLDMGQCEFLIPQPVTKSEMQNPFFLQPSHGL